MAQNRGVLRWVEGVLLMASCPIWCPIACCFILLDRDPQVEHMEDKLELVRQKRFGIRCPTKLPASRKRELSRPPPIQREQLAVAEGTDPVGAVEDKPVKETGVEVKLAHFASKLHLKKVKAPKPQVAMSTQEQCMLLTKLPVEIRRMIWEEVLGDHVLNINHDWFKGPRKFEALRKRDRMPLFHRCWDNTRSVSVYGDYEDRFWRARFLLLNECPHLHHPIRLLSLPLACRQTYMECIDLLYQTNFFSFRHLFQLTYLHSSILPQRMSQLRYVRLQWRFPVNPWDGDNIQRKWNRPPWDLKTWNQAMDALSAMTGLRHLLIVVGGRFDDGNVLTKGALLLNLARVRVPKTARFEVCVPWMETGMDRMIIDDGLPYTLLRIQDVDMDFY